MGVLGGHSSPTPPKDILRKPTENRRGKASFCIDPDECHYHLSEDLL